MTARARRTRSASPNQTQPLDEAELDRILPPIDESDPEWQAYVQNQIREALDDPRPPIPAKEVRRRILERHEAYLKRGS
jgi:hypothetical protein